MHPTSHRPLNCTHLEHASTWLIYQHKGLSCQALSPLPSSPRSSAGCIQGQLTDKRDLSETLLLALELLQKKNLKKPYSCFGEPLLWSFSESLYSGAVFKLRFSSLSPNWATLQQHCSHSCTWTHTPNDPNPDPTHELAFLIWTPSCLAAMNLPGRHWTVAEPDHSRLIKTLDCLNP